MVALRTPSSAFTHLRSGGPVNLIDVLVAAGIIPSPGPEISPGVFDADVILSTIFGVDPVRFRSGEFDADPSVPVDYTDADVSGWGDCDGGEYDEYANIPEEKMRAVLASWRSDIVREIGDFKLEYTAWRSRNPESGLRVDLDFIDGAEASGHVHA